MKFAVSPRQRWELANIFLREDMKEHTKTLADKKLFNRTRLAMGLTPVCDALMDLQPNGKVMINRTLGSDRKTKHFVDLNSEQVDLLVGKILATGIPAHQTMVLDELIEALDTAKVTGTAPEVSADLPGIPAEEWLVPDDNLADPA